LRKDGDGKQHGIDEGGEEDEDFGDEDSTGALGFDVGRDAEWVFGVAVFRVGFTDDVGIVKDSTKIYYITYNK
jgi:hypothetical protein